jgi:glucose/arabinose dehydrogenase
VSAFATTQLGSPTVQAADPPAGFVDELIGSFSRPTAVEWLPGNRIVVLEQGGQIRVGTPGGSFTTAASLNVCSNSERGLLGLAPDPGFLGNGWVYVYYTHAGPNGCVNRVSRFTMTNDSVATSSEVVLLDNIASTGGNHNGGDLDVGSDGLLYVAIGDAGTDPRGNSGSAGSNDAAQDLSLLNGKIVRITRSGDPAPGNAFSGADTTRCATLGTTSSPTVRCQEIYAWGLRNPYRFAFDRDDGSDRFYINDVGQSTYEEVSEGAVGNFGWPSREGPCPQGQVEPCAGPPAGVIDPITAYGRNDGAYITAGAFVPDGLWDSTYDGTYFFADGGSGDIWLMDDNGDVDYGDPFATGAGGITDMVFGFDETGAMVLYYVLVSGQLRAITPLASDALVGVSDLALEPITPIRAYDTGDGTGVSGAAAGDVLAATTRVVDLDPPGGTRAALVNITMADTAGPGFVRTWESRKFRPETSSVNADRANATVGNAVVVALAGDGTFVLEAATGTRVVVDVMAWLVETSGTSAEGRFVGLDPARLIDTRETSGTVLDSGSDNVYSEVLSTVIGGPINAEWGFQVMGKVGVPDGADVSAAVLSVAAIPRPGLQGRVTLVPAGSPDSGTASVNVTPGDVRNNLVVVPLAGDADDVTAYGRDLDDIVVDVLGFVTGASAATEASGLYTPIAPTRIVDSREDLGFGRLTGGAPSLLAVPGSDDASAVAQTITVTQPSDRGWIVAHPSEDTRGTLAFTRLTGEGSERVTARVDTDVVIDMVGFFSN